MRGLVSTAASRAWLVVVVVGLVVVGLVLGLRLIPRLTAGQRVIDAAKPAFADGAVRGEVAATKHLTQYIDLVDPIAARKREIEQQTEELVTMISRRTGVSNERARAFLRREAPRTEALLRALPLSAVANERARLTSFLATTLNVAPEDLQDEFARTFPKLLQTLSELPAITGGWYDVPGIDGMTRLDGKPRVGSMHGFGNYVGDDLVATVAAEQDRFGQLAGRGGIGYIPYLLLIVGIVVLAFGLLQTRRAANHPPDRLAWGVVVAAGALLLVLVGALGYFGRLDGAETTVKRLAPAFEPERVTGLRAGTDLAVRAVSFGDPIMTPAGGAAQEYPKLVTFVAERSGLKPREVRSRLRKAAPRTTALLDAIPLSAVGEEVPHLVGVLSRKLGMSGSRLVRTLQKRTPGLAQVILTVGPVASGWNAIGGTADLERFDGVTPVRSAPQFAEYLDRDIVAVFEGEREHFEALADPWPPLGVLPSILTAIGLLLVIYGVAMMFLATKPPRRY